MLVHVDITTQDIKLLGNAASKRAQKLPRVEARPWRRRIILGAGFFALASIIAIVRVKADVAMDANFLYGILVAAIFCGVFVYFFLEEQRKLLPNENGFMLGSKSYEIGDSGVTESWQHGEAKFRWAGIHGVEETSSHVFVFVDRCAAMILPKRCFDSDEKLGELLARLNRYTKDEDGMS